MIHDVNRKQFQILVNLKISLRSDQITLQLK